MANDSATSRSQELLDAIAQYVGDSKDKARELALKLIDDEGTKAVGEIIKKKGESKRTADVSEKVSELETSLKEARDKIAEQNNQIRELESKEPNWQRRLEENDRKWQAKVDAAESKVLTERQESLRDKVGIERAKFIAALRIGQPGGVTELVGDLLPAKYADRFVPDPESRSVKVLEAGEQDAYYDPSEGEPAEQLARDVINKLAPAARIVGDPDNGGGTGQGSVMDKAVGQIRDQKARTGAYQL